MEDKEILRISHKIVTKWQKLEKRYDNRIVPYIDQIIIVMNVFEQEIKKLKSLNDASHENDGEKN